MTDYIDVSMFGDKKLQRKLGRLVIQTQRKIVRGAMRKSMKPVKDRAQSLAPVKTSRLRNSIHQKQRTKKGITRAFVSTGTREDLGIKPNAKGYYPAVIEYGTRTQAAKSYLRRALGEMKTKVINTAGRLIGDGIEKEARR